MQGVQRARGRSAPWAYRPLVGKKSGVRSSDDSPFPDDTPYDYGRIGEGDDPAVWDDYGEGFPVQSDEDGQGRLNLT